MLEKKKTPKSQIKIGAGKDAHGMTEEDIADETERNASSTLTKEE